MNYCPNCGYHLGTNTPPLPGSTSVQQCPTEGTCSWSILDGGKRWRCAHGVEVTKHPAGWCNGGCCR